MSWLITLIVGAVVGLLFGWAMGWRRGAWYSIVTGIVGAITGYWLFVDVFRFGTMDTSIGYFQGVSLIWELIGAIVVMALISALQFERSEMRNKMETEGKHAFGPGVAHEYKEEKRGKHDDDSYK